MDPQLWTRLQDRWNQLCPALARGGFNAPATERQVEAIEALIGSRLPDELRTAYLHANGMQPQAPMLLLGNFRWVDLQTLATDWVQDRCAEARDDFGPDIMGPEEVDQLPVRQLMSHPGWLPIGHSGTSVRLYVDLAPGPCGWPGQAIRHDPEDGAPSIAAPSFSACIDVVLDALDRDAVALDGQLLVSRASGYAPSTHACWSAV